MYGKSFMLLTEDIIDFEKENVKGIRIKVYSGCNSNKVTQITVRQIPI